MSDPQDPKAVIQELIDVFGYSEDRIAKEMREIGEGVTTSQPSVNRIKRDKQEPRWNEAKALVKLRDKVRSGSELNDGGNAATDIVGDPARIAGAM